MNHTNTAFTARLATILAISILFAGCRSDDETTGATKSPNATTANSATGWDPNPPGKGTSRPRINLGSSTANGYTSVAAGEYYSFAPATLPGSKYPMLYSVENLPSWADFNAQTGEVFGTPTATDIGEHPNVVVRGQNAESRTYASTPALFVIPEPLGEENFSPLGTVIALPDGYQSIGDLELAAGEFVQTFENADLDLAFDADGNLLDLAGEGDLPTELTENVSVDAGISSRVGMLTGAQINADPSFGITLMDDINYLAFRVSAGLDITIGDPDDPGVFQSVTLETPAAGEIIMITDPTDHFFYHFGGTPLVGEYGEGRSRQGLIPFVPELDYPGLDTFSGHKIQKGSMGIGFKVFDFFEVGGTRVIKQPQYFSDINWTDPFNSPIEYKAGINGDFNFSFSVLSVGLFSFDLARGSGTLDVGFDRQQAALAIEIDPDESWLPDWFHWVPRTAVTGETFINGDTSFEMRLNGTWESTIPPAELAGSITINNNSTTLEGAIGQGPDTLYTSIEFANDMTTGRVRFNPAYSAGIKDDVLDALDREFVAVEQAISDLEAAVSGYEFELSLQGLRTAIPAMADGATSSLNAIPGAVYSAARSGTISYLKNTCKDFGWPVGKWCLDDVVNASSTGTSIGNSAKNTATSYIAPLKTAMANLKSAALLADDDQFIAAIESALRTAAANYRYSRNIKKTVYIGWPFKKTYTVYNQTYSVNVLSTTQRNQLLAAADNVYRIDQAKGIVISTTAIVDALPTQEIIDDVRAEVEAGIAQIPEPEGLGYRAINNTYEPFIIVGGDEIDIGFNVLSPSEVATGVSDWIADQLLGGG